MWVETQTQGPRSVAAWPAGAAASWDLLSDMRDLLQNI